jgi:chromosome segregation ATPase
MLIDGQAEEIAIDSSPGEELTQFESPAVDPDFEMVDSMFEDKPSPPTDLSQQPMDAERSRSPFDEPAEKTVVGFMPPALMKRAEAKTPPPGLPPFQSSASNAGMDPSEARELRSRVTELTLSLDEARTQATELDNRVHELESQLETRQTELETARASTGKSESKEVFALRDAANKKDKEILRLKNELNAKEQEIVELREKENTLEQQASETSGEMARRDAQLRTAQGKADQLGTERKKVDQQLMQAREEGRANAARLSTLQADYDALQARANELEAQVEPTRMAQQEAESARALAEAELSEARGEIEALKSQLDERSREADEVRGLYDQTNMDLDATRSQLATQASSFADELSGLRQKLADAEAETQKHEDRAGKHQARVKAQQDHLERLRIGLQQTLQQLEDATSEGDELEIDELAEA